MYVRVCVLACVRVCLWIWFIYEGIYKIHKRYFILYELIFHKNDLKQLLIILY